MIEEKFVDEPEIVYEGDVKLSVILHKLYGKINLFTGPNPNDIILTGTHGQISIFKRRPENDEEKVKRLVNELQSVLGPKKTAEYLQDKLFLEEAPHFNSIQ